MAIHSSRQEPTLVRRRWMKFFRPRCLQLEDRTVPALFNVQTAVSFTGLNNNGCVATADFDHDGRTDAILTDFGTDYSGGAGSTIHVLYGKAGGGFNALSKSTSGTNVSFVTIADINGDGWADAVVTNANGQNAGSVSVFKNDGAGNLSRFVTFSSSSNNPSWVGLADITGDGVLDVVVGSFGKDDGTGENVVGNNITIFAGNADATGHGDFTYSANPIILASSVQFIPTALAVADFNGDGIQDIAAAVPGVPADTGEPQPDGTVYVFQGTGGGGFSDPNQYDTGGALPLNIQAADVNGDGKPDLVVANAGDPNGIPEFLNNSVGVILNVSTPASVDFGITNSLTPNCHGTFAVAVADFDMDGKPDIAAVNYGSEFGTSPAAFVSAYKGDGSGGFAPFAPGTFDTQTGIGGGQYLAVGDFNGDGSPDLIVAHASNKVGLMTNTTVPAPTINQAAGQADPTNGSAINYDVVFPSDVTGFDATDVDLTGSTGGGAGLSAAVAAIDARHYTVTVTGMLPGTTGTVKATFPAGAATITSSGNPTPAPTSTDNLVNYDYVAPTVTINQAASQADPTTAGPIQFTVVFSEPVTGFTSAGVDLSASSLTGLSATVTKISATGYTVSVNGMATNGTVVAQVKPGAAADAAGNPSAASTSTDNTVTFGSAVAPTVTINQGSGQADPTNASPITFDVHFSQSVFGFDGSDVRFNGSTVGGTLQALVSGGGQDYTVTVTGMTGAGTVVATVPAGVATNAGGIGNSASTSADNTVTFDAVPPSVTVNQAGDQADPTNVSSIRFDVKFSEPVSGFDAADVSLGGSTAGGTLTATVTGSLDTYVVTVTGMTTRGAVVVGVPAGGAADAAGNLNLDSTSTDNSVEFLNTGTIGFSQAVYQGAELGANATVTITVTRAGQTDGAVSIDYATHDGTAKAGGSVLKGQADYVPTNGTLSWADGEGGSKTFTVQVLDDRFNEGKELIGLDLTNPIGDPGLTLTSSAVAIDPSDGQGPGAYFDQDGDKYTIRLAGKTGSLLYYRTDPDGDGRGPIELIQLSDTLPDPLHPKAALVIGVVKAKTSADGGTVGLGAVTGPGLRTILARRATLNGDGIDLTGYVGSITIGNVKNGADITTGATTNPLQRTRINALAIGDGTAINVATTVGGLTASSFGDGSVTAPAVGTMIVRGNMAADVTAPVVGSIIVRGNMTGDIHVTGVPDSTTKSLRLLRVRGAVTGSDIMVTGNVGAVVVGAFRDSRLFAGYTGPDEPDPNGFNFGATIGSFRNTGAAGAFENSRVVATNVMSAFLRNIALDNGSNPFGFFAQNTVVRLTYAGPPPATYVPTLGNLWSLHDFVVETQIV